MHCYGIVLRRPKVLPTLVAIFQHEETGATRCLNIRRVVRSQIGERRLDSRQVEGQLSSAQLRYRFASFSQKDHVGCRQNGLQKRLRDTWMLSSVGRIISDRSVRKLQMHSQVNLARCRNSRPRLHSHFSLEAITLDRYRGRNRLYGPRHSGSGRGSDSIAAGCTNFPASGCRQKDFLINRS